MFSSEHAKLHASLSVNGHGWSALLSSSSASRSSSACCERVMAGHAAGAQDSFRGDLVTLLMVHFGQQAYRPRASPRGRSDHSRLRRREYRTRGGDVRVARLPAGSLMVREQVHDIQCGRRRLQAYMARRAAPSRRASTHPTTPGSTSRTTTRRSTRCHSSRDVRLTCDQLPARWADGVAAAAAVRRRCHRRRRRRRRRRWRERATGRRSAVSVARNPSRRGAPTARASREECESKVLNNEVLANEARVRVCKYTGTLAATGRPTLFCETSLPPSAAPSPPPSASPSSPPPPPSAPPSPPVGPPTAVGGAVAATIRGAVASAITLAIATAAAAEYRFIFLAVRDLPGKPRRDASLK